MTDIKKTHITNESTGNSFRIIHHGGQLTIGARIFIESVAASVDGKKSFPIPVAGIRFRIVPADGVVIGSVAEYMEKQFPKLELTGRSANHASTSILAQLPPKFSIEQVNYVVNFMYQKLVEVMPSLEFMPNDIAVSALVKELQEEQDKFSADVKATIKAKILPLFSGKNKDGGTVH